MYTRRQLLIVSATALVGAACSRVPSQQNGMLARKGGALPDYVRPGVPALAYRAALNAPAALQASHCYCGCDQLADPHRSLYDCFITSKGTFADHGATCGTCQAEALDAERWLNQGMSLREIGAAIDAKYEPMQIQR